MKVRGLALLLVFSLFFLACRKNTVSKIPQIQLTSFMPADSVTANVGVVYIEFNLEDGDGDIGNGSGSAIYIKDTRFDTGFVAAEFPPIDPTVEDPAKGLQGSCLFYPDPQPTPRPDSIHATIGDTMSYQFYIQDRAGHKSNIITTHKLIIRP